MKDATNVTIAVLLVTATLLGVAVWLTGGSNSAVAAQAQSVGSSYILGVGEISSSQDMLYVIDTHTEQLNVYMPSNARRGNEIVLIAGPLDLRALTASAVDDRSPIRR